MNRAESFCERKEKSLTTLSLGRFFVSEVALINFETLYSLRFYAQRFNRAVYLSLFPFTCNMKGDLKTSYPFIVKEDLENSLRLQVIILPYLQ